MNFDFKNLKKKCKLFYDEYLGSKFKKSWILCWGGGWIVVRDLSFTTTTTTDIFLFVLLFIYSVSLADLPGAICCTKIHGKKEEKCFIFLVKCCLVQRFFIMRYSKKYPVVMTTKKTEKGEMNMNSKIFTTYLYLSKILKPTFILF